MPLPGRSFSCTAKARWVEAITVVRSGVTSPRMMERPASIHSAASTTSTSPGVGMRAKIGPLAVPFGEHLDVVDRGPGALRHARHGGRLRGPALRFGEATIQSASTPAALPAHGEDRDRDRPVGREPPEPRRVDERHERYAGPGSTSPEGRHERDTPAVAAALQGADDAAADPRQQTVPACRVRDDVGTIEGRAENRGFGDLAAIAAADAGVVDRRHGVVAQEVGRLLHATATGSRTGACRRGRPCRRLRRPRTARARPACRPRWPWRSAAAPGAACSACIRTRPR